MEMMVIMIMLQMWLVMTNTAIFKEMKKGNILKSLETGDNGFNDGIKEENKINKTAKEIEIEKESRCIKRRNSYNFGDDYEILEEIDSDLGLNLEMFLMGK